MDNPTEYKKKYCESCSVNPLCSPKSFVNNDVLFINYDVKLDCINALSFGYGYFCTCEGRILHYRNFHK